MGFNLLVNSLIIGMIIIDNTSIVAGALFCWCC